MKKYLKNFLRYKYLLTELVKKNIKLKYRRSYLGNFMDADRAIAHDACIDVGVWYILW